MPKRKNPHKCRLKPVGEPSYPSRRTCSGATMSELTAKGRQRKRDCQREQVTRMLHKETLRSAPYQRYADIKRRGLMLVNAILGAQR
jgi:hypothetical protein